MKKSIILILIVINFFLSNFLSFSSRVYAYPGDEGNCLDHHGITIIKVPYDENANIILDGIPSEYFWHDINNQIGKIRVPLASLPDAESFSVIYANLTFVMNNKYLFILCEWLDNTTIPNLDTKIYDCLFFCWNIDVSNFSSDFLIAKRMRTLEMGGGKVDSWGWIINNDMYPEHSNGSSHDNGIDRCFGTYDWYGSELQDVEVSYTYYTNFSYIVEIKRELTTIDQYDVQFNEKKLYKFNLAVNNDSILGDHAISWTYALDLREETTEGDDNDENITNIQKLNLLFLFVLIILIVMVIIIVIIFYQKKVQNRGILRL